MPCVITQGAAATGVVKEVEPRRRLGHGGKLAFSIDSVRLKDNEKRRFALSRRAVARTMRGSILPWLPAKTWYSRKELNSRRTLTGDEAKEEAFQAEKPLQRSAGTPKRQATPPGY